ncbi:MAG: hypothetical protein QOJ19_4780, partial [Acidimicrobiia bacterium]|nr:hypothetical protein [Acidimicrobiia bacterium]
NSPGRIRASQSEPFCQLRPQLRPVKEQRPYGPDTIPTANQGAADFDAAGGVGQNAAKPRASVRGSPRGNLRRCYAVRCLAYDWRSPASKVRCFCTSIRRTPLWIDSPCSPNA